MILEINTPGKVFYKGEVEMVTLPGKSGMFTVLENHAPIISELTANKIRIRDAKKDISFKVSRGFAIVNKDLIVVNVESVIIDIE